MKVTVEARDSAPAQQEVLMGVHTPVGDEVIGSLDGVVIGINVGLALGEKVQVTADNEPIKISVGEVILVPNQ